MAQYTKPTTLPRWAETAAGAPASNITTPTSGQQDTGWTVGQQPPSSIENFLKRYTYDWIQYLRDAGFTATSGSGYPGVSGTGDTNQPGVLGTGNGTAAGVSGTGGATNGYGGAFTGGGTNGGGVNATGVGTGAGITGTGGTSNGYGGSFTGGSTNGGGVNGAGVGSGAGGSFTGGASGIGVKATQGSGQTAPALLASGSIQHAVTTTLFPTVAINAALGNEFLIPANTASAYTIGAPTNAPSPGTYSQRITIRVQNTSGGTLGTATWNSVYRMNAWTNPASGYTWAIEFQQNASGNWTEVSRNASQIPL